MTTTQLSRSAIIQDTVDFYSVDPRGRRAINPAATLTGGGARCVYITEDGERRCAVGRHMSDPLTTMVGGVGTLEQNIRRNLDDLLVPEARGHPLHFWKDLQYLHDSDHHWVEEGLSPAGATELQAIRDQWGDE